MTRDLPYEGTHVAATFLSLGAFAAMLLNEPTEVVPWGFQQTPLDHGIGDNMLQVADRFVLFEFKRDRAAHQDEWEKDHRDGLVSDLWQRPANDQLRKTADIAHIMGYGVPIGSDGAALRFVPYRLAAQHHVLEKVPRVHRYSRLQGMSSLEEMSLPGLARGVFHVLPADIQAVLGEGPSNDQQKAGIEWDEEDISKAAATPDLGAPPTEFFDYLKHVLTFLADEDDPADGTARRKEAGRSSPAAKARRALGRLTAHVCAFSDTGLVGVGSYKRIADLAALQARGEQLSAARTVPSERSPRRIHRMPAQSAAPAQKSTTPVAGPKPKPPSQ